MSNDLQQSVLHVDSMREQVGYRRFQYDRESGGRRSSRLGKAALQMLNGALADSRVSDGVFVGNTGA